MVISRKLGSFLATVFLSVQHFRIEM